MGKVLYRWYRYYCPGERWMDSLKGAIQRARHDVDYNLASPHEIRDEAGNLLMNREQIIETIWADDD